MGQDFRGGIEAFRLDLLLIGEWCSSLGGSFLGASQANVRVRDRLSSFSSK